MKPNTLKIGKGVINLVESTLNVNHITGKVLYVADPFVDSIYGSVVREQICNVGRIKEELCSQNTISYSMNIAERVIATDVSCIVGLGGGRTLDVCKYAAYVSKTPYLALPTTAANDGLCSPIAVLKRKDEKPKSLGAAMPTMALIDTQPLHVFVFLIVQGPRVNLL